MKYRLQVNLVRIRYVAMTNMKRSFCICNDYFRIYILLKSWYVICSDIRSNCDYPSLFIFTNVRCKHKPASSLAIPLRPTSRLSTFSTDETLAFDVQMKSIGQKSLLTRRSSFLPRFLPSFSSSRLHIQSVNFKTSCCMNWSHQSHHYHQNRRSHQIHQTSKSLVISSKQKI